MGTVYEIPAGAWLGNNVMGIWPRDEGALTRGFLQLVLEAADLRSTGVISGQVQEQVTRQSLGRLEINLPPVLAQRRIVDLIGALRTQMDTLQAEERACNVMLAALRKAHFEALDGTVDLTSVMSKVMSGGTPSRTRTEFYGGAIPWLKSGEVASPFILRTKERITMEGLAGSSAWVVPAGAVVVAMYGATAAEVGFLGAPMATNQAVLALVPNRDRCDGRFAYHCFRHHSARLKEAASGAAQPNLSKAVILREVGYPDLDIAERRSIGQVLDAVSTAADLLGQERQTSD